jgi:hypothetical protein
MGSSYARSFASLHLPRHTVAPGRNHHSTPPLRSRSDAMTGSVAPHSVVVLELLLAELVAAQRAPKMPAFVHQRQEQAALSLPRQRHHAQLRDPPAQVMGSSYSHASAMPTATTGSGSCASLAAHSRKWRQCQRGDAWQGAHDGRERRGNGASMMVAQSVAHLRWTGRWDVRLSDADFLVSPANSDELFLISSTNVNAGVDMAAYDRAVMALLNATVRHTVDASSWTRMFTMGQLVGLDPTIPNIWSMAQCYLRGCPTI